jgi:hypothetical protein
MKEPRNLNVTRVLVYYSDNRIDFAANEQEKFE